MSIYICFGKYGGFHIKFGGGCIFHICLGFISFCIMPIDIEILLSNIKEEVK